MAKVLIDGTEYETDLPPEWTFREELEVRRLTRLKPADVFVELTSGANTLPALACAIVGYMRKFPDKEPDALLNLKQTSIVLDLREDDEREVDAANPPADGAAEAPADE